MNEQTPGNGFNTGGWQQGQPMGSAQGQHPGQAHGQAKPKRRRRLVRKTLALLAGSLILLIIVAVVAGQSGGGRTKTIGAGGRTQTIGARPPTGATGGAAGQVGGAAGSGTAASPGAAGSGTETVTYRITSDSGRVSPTWTTATGQGQATDASAPWTVTVTGQLIFASLVAQMGSPDGSTISCEIDVNGKVVAQQTSTGQFAVVSCYGG